MSSKKLLILGPKYNNKSSIGGVVVLFEDFIKSCKKHKINFKVIDTNKTSYSNRFIALLKIYISFFKQFRNFDHISIHCSINDFIFISPVFVLASKVFGKEISLRKFAGGFHEYFKNSNFLIRKTIGQTIKSADFVFFETKFLIQKFKNFNSKTYWWPNSRNKSSLRVSKDFNKRFVFISQIKESKGINEIINAAKHLDNSYTFDFYGPILDNNFERKIDRLSNVSYKGVLSPNAVVSTLKKYNILILPTYHNGEGYPGIIIEAFSVGMPVISTHWSSIPELISHKKNGLLVPIKDLDSLVNSISFYDQKKYRQFSESALNSFNKFNSKEVNLNFFKKIKFIDVK